MTEGPRTKPLGGASFGYPFPELELRAVCLRVVDGDTVDLLVDRGFRVYSVDRFRLLGIDAPELRDSDPERRALAVKARERVVEILSPGEVDVPVPFWDVLVRPRKDPDSFGRWLADLWSLQPDGAQVHVASALRAEGLADERTR